MAKIRLLLDEDVRPLLAEVLRQRGYDAYHPSFAPKNTYQASAGVPKAIGTTDGGFSIAAAAFAVPRSAPVDASLA
jgi:hypothetical protein